MKYTRKQMSYIYGLIDPSDNMVKYVGQSIDPLNRLSQHLFDIPFNNKKGNWIKELKKKKISPYVVIFKKVLLENGHRVETKFIQEYKNSVLNTHMIVTKPIMEHTNKRDTI